MIRSASSLIHTAIAILASATLAACSTGGAEMQTGAALAPGQPAPVSQQAYQMSERELKLSCKDLTGAMRVRILQVKSSTTAQQSGTVAARTLQSGATAIWGGPSYGSNPSADHDRDLAQLDAYNRQLAAKNCPTLDLPAELNAAPAAPGAQAKTL